MKIDELQSLWNSGINQPTAEQRDRTIDRFTLSLRRGRRRQFVWLVWTFFVLTTITAFAAWQIFTPGKVNLATEWALIPLLLIPWTFAGLFLKRFVCGRRAAYPSADTIAGLVAAAMAANKAERLKLRLIGVMYVIFLPVLAFSVSQLHSAGKVSSRELGSMAVFFGVVLALGGAAILAKYRLKLMPEREKLQDVMDQSKEVPGTGC